MKMYKCSDCGCEFDDPIEIRTSYENYFGVGGLFPNHNYMTYQACPCCHSEDFEEVYEYEEDEE